MSDLSRVEQILAAKAAGTTWDGTPLSRLEEELLSIDFSKEPVVVESFSEMTEPGVIYIMRTGSSGGKDIYEEFILVDGVPEKLGHNVDIDAYTKDETDNLLSAKVDKEEGKSLFSGSYNDLEDQPSIPTTTTTAITLSTSGWSSGIYNLENMWPSSTYNIQVDLYESTTAAQATAWQNAQIVGSVTNNRLKALGTVPTVAIPVMVTATTK